MVLRNKLVKKRSRFTQLTLWLFNIAMENDPFIDDFPIKTSIYKGFSMAMLNNQMVFILFCDEWGGLSKQPTACI